MDKNEIISYLKEHPEDLIGVTKELGLCFAYENREHIRKTYDDKKEDLARIERFKKNPEQWEKIWEKTYNSLKSEITYMEKLYHIFDLTENNLLVKWYPVEFENKKTEVFDYRKSMFNTVMIAYDMELDKIVTKDLQNIQYAAYEKHTDIYKAFPIYETKETIADETNRYYNGKDYQGNVHQITKYICTYALEENGGIAMVERRVIMQCKNHDDIVDSSFILLTLGEDDGDHFMHCSYVYERYNGNNEKFNNLLSKAIETRNKYIEENDRH